MKAAIVTEPISNESSGDELWVHPEEASEAGLTVGEAVKVELII
jgi:hypothetical protein